jgi:5-methylcytosine-specific restriction endonuclease McrA
MYNKFNLCELCLKERSLTFHHLIPRAVHGNKWFQKNYDGVYMDKHGLMLCKECHKSVHDLIPDEKELGKNWNTLELLLSNEKVANYVKWQRKRL